MRKRRGPAERAAHAAELCAAACCLAAGSALDVPGVLRMVEGCMHMPESRVVRCVCRNGGTLFFLVVLFCAVQCVGS